MSVGAAATSGAVPGSAGDAARVDAALVDAAVRDDGVLVDAVTPLLRDRPLPLPAAYRWLVAPALRLVEYGVWLLLAALAGGAAVPAVFALLFVLAYHHYDVLNRLRLHGSAPPGWLRRVGGGWELRLLVAVVLAVGGWLRPGAIALAAWLAVLYGVESTLSWYRSTTAAAASAAAPAPAPGGRPAADDEKGTP